jgi:chemotaxis receptor (MCP) glutamine deamidase CheD
MRFNFQLLQIEDTKHLLDTWKQEMIEVENQDVGSQVVRAISFTKKESDIIIMQLKLQHKELYKK